jgi:cytochrome b
MVESPPAFVRQLIRKVAEMSTTLPTDPPTVRTRVWDLPTRLFHWSLVFCVFGLIATAYGGDGMLMWHVRLGHTVLALVVFRLVWGIVGGHWSRFWQFSFSPVTVLRYVRGQATPGVATEVGHSPLGALSVYALLFILCIQLWTGLVIDDEVAFQGPLNRFVSGRFVEWATSWHRVWGQWFLIALVVAHIAAIQLYLMRKKDLLTPMIGGDKLLPPGTPASRDGARQRVLAMWLFIACAWMAWSVYKLL